MTDIYILVSALIIILLGSLALHDEIKNKAPFVQWLVPLLLLAFGMWGIYLLFSR